MPRILALGSGVIYEISELLLQAETPPQLAALTSFTENLPASIRCDLAGQLLAIGQSSPTVNGLRCAPSIADLFPAEVAHAAPALAQTVMTLLANADDDGRYALLVAVSIFVRATAVAQRDAFVSELFALEPEVALWEGSRQIARDVGAAFAPVLLSIVPYLLQTARQDIEMVIDSVSHGRSGGAFIPGQNKVFRFNLEQFRDMQRAVESLTDYARATGRGFLPWAEDAVKSANYVSRIISDCSADLRASTAKLLAAICIAVASDSAGELAGRPLELASPEIEVEIAIISIVITGPS
jgi:hypothetical protein